MFAFVYSTCRDTCPAQVQTIRNALDKLDDPDAHVIGISVDPVNDNPKRAASFLLKQQMTGRMRFLLGTREQLEPVWKASPCSRSPTGSSTPRTPCWPTRAASSGSASRSTT